MSRREDPAAGAILYLQPLKTTQNQDLLTLEKSSSYRARIWLNRSKEVK
jgi:hypothetical protein